MIGNSGPSGGLSGPQAGEQATPRVTSAARQSEPLAVFPPGDVGQVQVAAVEELLNCGGAPLDLVIGDESVRLPTSVREALAHVTKALRAGQAVIVLPHAVDMPSELRKQ